MAASIHTHNFRNAVMLVWGLLRLAPIIYRTSTLSVSCNYPYPAINCITCKILVPKYCRRQLNTKVCNIEIDPLLDALSYHKHAADVQF